MEWRCDDVRWWWEVRRKKIDGIARRVESKKINLCRERIAELQLDAKERYFDASSS